MATVIVTSEHVHLHFIAAALALLLTSDTCGTYAPATGMAAMQSIAVHVGKVNKLPMCMQVIVGEL